MNEQKHEKYRSLFENSLENTLKDPARRQDKICARKALFTALNTIKPVQLDKIMQEKEETHPLFGLVHFNEIADKYHLTGRVILPYNYGGFVQDIVMRTNAGGKKNYYVCGIDAGEAYDGHALCGSPAAWENSSWSKEWSQGTRSNIWCWAFAFPPSPVFFEVNVEKGKDLFVPVYSLNE